jgi:hypothetical protein
MLSEIDQFIKEAKGCPNNFSTGAVNRGMPIDEMRKPPMIDETSGGNIMRSGYGYMCGEQIQLLAPQPLACCTCDDYKKFVAGDTQVQSECEPCGDLDTELDECGLTVGGPTACCTCDDYAKFIAGFQADQEVVLACLPCEGFSFPDDLEKECGLTLEGPMEPPCCTCDGFLNQRDCPLCEAVDYDDCLND